MLAEQIPATIFSEIFLPFFTPPFPVMTPLRKVIRHTKTLHHFPIKMGRLYFAPHPVHHSILCSEFLPDILYAVGKKFITCYDYSERAFSVAQLSTNAETTSSQEPLPAAYNCKCCTKTVLPLFRWHCCEVP